jgi:hypothetical protein
MNIKGLYLKLCIGYSLAKIKSPFDTIFESKSSIDMGLGE